jgi:hypothetical protein
MRECWQIPLIAAFSLAIAGLAGCSRSTLSREEARSEIRSAVSFTAEAELFVDFVRGGHATRHYAEGHAAYLADAIKRSAENLEQAVPEAGTESAVRECITQLKRLDRELSGIHARLDDQAALARASGRIRGIRKDLERAQSEL